MKLCQYCSQLIPDEARVCPYCGVEVVSRTGIGGYNRPFVPRSVTNASGQARTFSDFVGFIILFITIIPMFMPVFVFSSLKDAAYSLFGYSSNDLVLSLTIFDFEKAVKISENLPVDEVGFILFIIYGIFAVMLIAILVEIIRAIVYFGNDIVRSIKQMSMALQFCGFIGVIAAISVLFYNLYIDQVDSYGFLGALASASVVPGPYILFVFAVIGQIVLSVISNSRNQVDSRQRPMARNYQNMPTYSPSQVSSYDSGYSNGTWNCPVCNAANRPQSSYCVKCGERRE